MDEIVSLTAGIDAWDILRFLMLVFLGIYIIFALIVLKQVRLMTQTLKVGFEVPIEAFAFFHLLAAIAIFLITLIV